MMAPPFLYLKQKGSFVKLKEWEDYKIGADLCGKGAGMSETISKFIFWGLVSVAVSVSAPDDLSSSGRPS